MENGLLEAIESDNFYPLIKEAKEYILTFSTRINSTVSLAIHFAQHFLNEDTELNRLVAFSLFLGLDQGIYEERELANLVVASFLTCIGRSQIPCSLNHRPLVQLRSDYQQLRAQVHQHNLNLAHRSLAPLTDQVLGLLECMTGPAQLVQGYSARSSDVLLLIHLSHTLFEYSSGRRDGVTRPFSQTLNEFSRKEIVLQSPPALTDKLVQKLKKFIMNTNCVKSA
jgi:hypothetical protein